MHPLFLPLLYVCSENVAVKIIEKTKLKDQSCQDLSREIACMERLCHPNVIRLFEVIEMFPRMYLVMECAAEGDVLDRVQSLGPFTNDFGRSVFTQIASAIHHMVHIDLCYAIVRFSMAQLADNVLQSIAVFLV